MSCSGRLRHWDHERDVVSQGKRAKELNDTIRYTMWSVFRLRDVIGDADRGAEAGELEKFVAGLGRTATSWSAACTT